MLEYLNTAIFISTSIVLLIVILYALGIGFKSQYMCTLVQKQVIQDGTAILSFLLPKNRKRLNLKIGQQILIKTKTSQKGRQFTPIQQSVGSFKILLIPQLQGNNDIKAQQTEILKQLQSLNKKDRVYVKIAKNNMNYIGKSQIRVTNSDKKIFVKKYSNIYVLTQGSKIPIAYQIIKGICEDKQKQMPHITVFFVGNQVSDFVLKHQFQVLEDNYDNIRYYFSIPVKGQRQPSVAGMGISSQKVAESFTSKPQQTFCILCTEQSDLMATVERALINQKVPANQIYKY